MRNPFLTLLMTLAAWSPALAYAAPDMGLEREIYQDELLRMSLKQTGLKLEHHPEGKRIEEIVVLTYDLFTPGDPWPEWLESVHAKTKDEVVRRELLFQEGDNWDRDVVEETGRNLRNYLPLAVAEIRACQGSAPDRVKVLIITKDIWSLRLDWSFSFADSKLEVLSLQMAEVNLGGWNRTVGVTYYQDIGAREPGLVYSDPRLFGSRVALNTAASLVYDRMSSGLEGNIESISIGQPLFALSTEWAWNFSAAHTKDIFRLYSAGNLAQFQSPTTGELLPYSYNQKAVNLSASITRSFGREWKQDLSGGWKGSTKQFSLPSNDPAVQTQTVTDFQNLVEPRSEDAGVLFVSYHFYHSTFIRLQDIDTFALTEDYHLGPDFTQEVGYANPAFGYSSRFIESQSTLAYRLFAGDDLLTFTTTFDTRRQPGVIPGKTWDDTVGNVVLQNASPRFWIFRLHTQAQVLRRWNDLNHGVATLGGDTLLRGYPSAFFVAPNLWTGNAELRTRPLEFHTVYIGGVGFLDMGNAFNTGQPPGLFASVGVGARFLFPQFNRSVLRMDLGFPLKPVPGVSSASFVAQFGQAFN